ncbi:MAG: hypothetical protein CBB60_002145 [Armatimonadetes bacterium Cent15-Ar3]|nr:MAG: hypothetical protein CBB60_002145 [Armatimonadetes bacterium Cent15-Ar3]
MALTDRERVAHLLRRFGFGASEAEIEYYAKDGWKSAVEKLLNPEAVDEQLEFPVENMENDKGNIQVQQVAGWWVGWMLMTRRPLVHKMASFWHNHFATSGDKVTQPYLMAAQNEIFVSKGLGKFEDLLTDVSKDPAMLIWLDGQLNIKGKANENFAREIMELFTLGVGNYSEKDVQEAARAFTGWSFARQNGGGRKGRAEYAFKPVLHDNGTKTVLGKSGNLTGEDVIAHVCSMPRTAEFITEKIWKWFVSDNPSPATLKPFIKAFYESKLDIKVLLRSIMLSEEFYSPKVVRRLIKNPLDFTVTTLRAMGIGENIRTRIAAEADGDKKRATLGPAQGAYVTMKSMGMWILFPPDVSGWKPGENWITSATMVERIQWANKLMGLGNARGAAGGNLKYPIYNLLAADPTTFGIAKKLCSIYDAPLEGAKLAKLAEAAEKEMAGQGLTPQNANKVAASIMKLIFGSPEFQFC